MDPVLSAALSSWDLRLDVILVLALAGTSYTWGWWRLRTRTLSRSRQAETTQTELGWRNWKAAAMWRPVVYLTGLFIVGIALVSPIDVLSAQLFTMHMIQHLLLVMIAPPILLLANPLPFILWGFPAKVRVSVGRQLLRRNSSFRRLLEKTTGPGLTWLYFVIAYWGWHDPTAYGAALESDLIHDLEHLSFFGTSMLFWWHVLGAGPRVHRPLSPLARLAYLLAAIPPGMLAGIAIAFAEQPLYGYYEAMPRLWGISVLADQRLAGVIMWIPGSMMYIVAFLILAGRWLQVEEKKPALPESAWAADDALMAPGWEK
jgi:putative membrane protein